MTLSEVLMKSQEIDVGPHFVQDNAPFWPFVQQQIDWFDLDTLFAKFKQF